jgi:hypothetical protein
MIPMERTRSEFARFINVGATRFVLVNVSDLRAVAMTAMDLAWGGVRPAQTARGHYRGRASAQSGSKTADAMADFYDSYFKAIPNAPAGKSYGDGMELGDQHYHQVTRELLLRTMVSPPYYQSFGQTPKWRAMQLYDRDDRTPGRWINETIAREQPICHSAAPVGMRCCGRRHRSNAS